MQVLQNDKDCKREAQGGPKYVADRKMTGAEIGVWRGKNSATLLARAPNLTLHMIDYWGDPSVPENGQCLQTVDAPCQEALDETSFATDRRVIVKCPSPAAAARYPDGMFDFVFIDGDHRYDHIYADLRAWWPKIAKGGWLMGHDIDHPSYEWGADVRRAVEEFCAEAGKLAFNTYPWPEMVFAIRKP